MVMAFSFWVDLIPRDLVDINLTIGIMFGVDLKFVVRLN